MESRIKILHFGNLIDSQLIESAMRDECLSCELKTTCDTDEYIDALKTEVFDVILSDKDEGVDTAFRLAKDFTPHTAFIMLCSPVNYEYKSANENNADKKTEKKYEFIPKMDMKYLAPTIHEVIENTSQKHDISCHWG